MFEREVLAATDEWIKNLKNLLPSVSSENQEYVQSRIELLERLREQVERVQGLEKRIKKELEYVSKYNGKLNEFLQKRKLPPNTLGRHVVEVIMNYVEELEQQNKRYREALEFYEDRENYEPEHYDPDTHDYTSMIDRDKGATARKALEGDDD